MAVREILEYPDPILRQVSAPVREFDDSLKTLVEDLTDTLYSTPGIALSAPQIGDLRQVMVMDLTEDHSRCEVFINPEILQTARIGIIRETCLSVPNVVTRVMRAIDVRVTSRDIDGNRFERDLTEMQAVCLQHEMDHFEGRLLIDRLSWLGRLSMNLKNRWRSSSSDRNTGAK